MFSFNPQVESPEVVLEKHISVKAAAEFFGYNAQYLRRLLRKGHLEGIKIGQVWLIKLASLNACLKRATTCAVQRSNCFRIPNQFFLTVPADPDFTANNGNRPGESDQATIPFHEPLLCGQYTYLHGSTINHEKSA